MVKPKPLHRTLTLSDSARYRIRVTGAIHPNRIPLLCGNWEVVTDQLDDKAISTLTGQVLDQAELMGLLTQLYGYGLPLVSVECLDVLQIRAMPACDNPA